MFGDNYTNCMVHVLYDWVCQIIAFTLIGRQIIIFILYQKAEGVEAWVDGPSSHASAVEPYDWDFAKVEANNMIYHFNSM